MTAPSYPPPGYPAPGPGPSRPGTVTIATYLLYLVVALQVINAILTFSMYGALSDALDGAFTGADAANEDTFKTGILVVIVGFGVLILVFALIFAMLAVFVGKGKNWARITTWVLGGLSVCCFGIGLSGGGVSRSLETTGSGDTPGAPSDAELERRFNEAMPAWHDTASTLVSVLLVLGLLAVIILLALPASNAFFRKTVPGYPGYGQPPYPGQAYQQPSPYPAAQYPPAGQPPYPGQPNPYGQPGDPAPGLPPYPGQAPGQPTPGLPPYPGQQSAPPSPPAGDPYAPPTYPGQQPPPPASDPFAPPRDEPPRPPGGPA